MKPKLITIILALAVFAALGGCASSVSLARTSQSQSNTDGAGNTARSAPQTTGPRYALVIGNAEYRNIEKLVNTVNDARDIAAALEGLGFNVDLKLNVGRLQFGAAVDGYVEKLATDSNSEGFFWYAGHGVQIGSQNYLLPVDAALENERVLRRDSYSLDELLADFENAGNKVNVVVLDACRNNPLPSSSRGAGTRGLAPVQDVPGDQFVMFSTAPGDVAADGKGSRNSPFTEAFLKHIDSTEPLVLMASDVINETMARTNNGQRPFSRGSIISDKRYSLNPDRQTAANTGKPGGSDATLAFFEEGVSRMSGSNWDAAIEAFTEAIRLDPQFTRAYSNRGLAYYYKGDYDRSIADYAGAIRLDPKDTDAYNNRGLAYGGKGDHDRAIADYTEAIRLDPQHIFAYNNRGNAYGKKGDYDRAIADLTEAIRLDPKDAVTYHNRGFAYDEKGDYDRAIADCTEAIRLDPQYARAYYGRGVAYGRKGDYDRAITDLTEVIRLDPQFVHAYFDRGAMYLVKGDSDRATADFIEVLRINPDFEEAKQGLVFAKMLSK